MNSYNLGQMYVLVLHIDYECSSIETLSTHTSHGQSTQQLYTLFISFSKTVANKRIRPTKSSAFSEIDIT